jgi:hypothetical protein
MPHDFDDFWHKPKLSPQQRRSVVQEELGRLTFGQQQAQAPQRQGPLDMTEEEREAARQRRDEMFAAGYVTIVGAPQPLSRELAMQYHYEVDRLPSPGTPYTAGDDPEARDD